ncbi:hypothetical protein DSECCO2_623850 [anaerobic digester metagenome]
MRAISRPDKFLYAFCFKRAMLGIDHNKIQPAVAKHFNGCGTANFMKGSQNFLPH